MPYFGKFPRLSYDLEVPQGNPFPRPLTTTDIFKRIALKQNLEDVGTIFASYSVKDEDTPEIIAHKLYGSSELHWVVVLVNDLINPFFDWPLSERKLVRQLDKKYPGSTFFWRPATISGNFLENKIVVNADSSASGLVTKVDVTLSFLTVENVSGIFQQGETIAQNAGDLGQTTAELTRLIPSSKNALHHFEDAQKKPMNSLTFRDGYIQGGNGFPGIVDAVTNEQFERDQNEAKRRIKLIHPDRISDILRDLETIFLKNESLRTA